VAEEEIEIVPSGGGFGTRRAAFADASLAASDVRSPLEINNASPPANAAAPAVKSDIRDRINAFMMSSDQSAGTASMRDSLG